MNRVTIEFPDFDNLDVFQAIFGVASINGFDDTSDCSDSMPSMTRVFQYERKPNATVAIYVDFKSIELSEMKGFREQGLSKVITILELNERDDIMFESRHDSAIDAILDLRNVINKYE